MGSGALCRLNGQAAYRISCKVGGFCRDYRQIRVYV